MTSLTPDACAKIAAALTELHRTLAATRRDLREREASLLLDHTMGDLEERIREWTRLSDERRSTAREWAATVGLREIRAALADHHPDVPLYFCQACGALSSAERAHFAIMRVPCRTDWHLVTAAQLAALQERIEDSPPVPPNR